jgi:hypothetical protein
MTEYCTCEQNCLFFISTTDSLAGVYQAYSGFDPRDSILSLIPQVSLQSGPIMRPLSAKMDTIPALEF